MSKIGDRSFKIGNQISSNISPLSISLVGGEIWRSSLNTIRNWQSLEINDLSKLVGEYSSKSAIKFSLSLLPALGWNCSSNSLSLSLPPARVKPKFKLFLLFPPQEWNCSSKTLSQSLLPRPRWNENSLSSSSSHSQCEIVFQTLFFPLPRHLLVFLNLILILIFITFTCGWQSLHK